MHLTDNRIDEIVMARALPCCARGQAVFGNRRRYDFDANFGHAYAANRIFVRQPTDAS